MKINKISIRLAPLLKSIIDNDFDVFTQQLCSIEISKEEIVHVLEHAMQFHRIDFVDFLFNTTTLVRIQPDMLTPLLLEKAVYSGISRFVAQVLTCSQGLKPEEAKALIFTHYKYKNHYFNILGVAILIGRTNIIEILLNFEPTLLIQTGKNLQEIEYALALNIVFNKNVILRDKIINLLISYMADPVDRLVLLEISIKLAYLKGAGHAPLSCLADFIEQQQKLGTLKQLETNYNEVKQKVHDKFVHMKELTDSISIIEIEKNAKLIELALIVSALVDKKSEMADFYIRIILGTSAVNDFVSLFILIKSKDDNVWIEFIDKLLTYIESDLNQFKFLYTIIVLAHTSLKIKAVVYALELMSKKLIAMLESKTPEEKLPFFNSNHETQLFPVIDSMILFSSTENQESTKMLFKKYIYEPIMLAIKNEHLELAFYFIKMNGNKCVRSHYNGKNYLHFLIENSTESSALILCVKLLIYFQININAPYHEYLNCFHYAVAKGKIETAKEILKSKPSLLPDLNKELNENDVKPLFSVFELAMPNLDMLAALIDAYADNDQKICLCYFLLLTQNQNNHSRLVSFLLNQLNTCLQKKWEAVSRESKDIKRDLFLAAENLATLYTLSSKKETSPYLNYIDCSELLKICFENDYLYSALYLNDAGKKSVYEHKENQLELFNLLVSTCLNNDDIATMLYHDLVINMNPFTRNSQNENSLDLAVKSGSAVFVKLLVRQFPKLIHEKTVNKTESLFYLIDEKSSLAKTAEKIDYYVNGFTTSQEKYNCYEFLAYACQIYSKADMVAHFIIEKMAQFNSELNAQKKKGVKKSSVICLSQRLANFQLILDSKQTTLQANPVNKFPFNDADGEITIEALTKGFIELAHSLIQKRKDINTYKQNLMLDLSVTKCRDKSILLFMVNYLIRRGLTLNCQNKNNENCLDLAIKKGNANLVSIILTKAPKLFNCKTEKNRYKTLLEVDSLDDKRAIIIEFLQHAKKIKQIDIIFSSMFSIFLFSHSDMTELLLTLANEQKIALDKISYEFRHNPKFGIVFDYALFQGWKNVTEFLIARGTVITEKQLNIASKSNHVELLPILFRALFEQKTLDLSECESLLMAYKCDLNENDFTHLLKSLQRKNAEISARVEEVVVMEELSIVKASKHKVTEIKQESSATLEIAPLPLSVLPCEVQSVEDEINKLKQECEDICSDLSAMIQSPDRVRLYNRILRDKAQMSEEAYDKFAKFYANAKIMVESRSSIKGANNKIALDGLRTNLVTLRADFIKCDEKIDFLQRKPFKLATQRPKVKTLEKVLQIKRKTPVQQKSTVKKPDIIVERPSELKSVINDESKLEEEKYVDHQVAAYMRGSPKRELQADSAHKQTLRYLQMAANLASTFIGYSTQSHEQKSIFFNIAKYALLRLFVCLRIEQSSGIFIILRDAFCHSQDHVVQEHAEKIIIELLNDCNEIYSTIKKETTGKFLTKSEETSRLQQRLSCSEAVKDIIYSWSIRAHKKESHLYSIFETLDSLASSCKEFQMFLSKPEILELIQETLHNEASQMISMQLGSHITTLKENILLLQEILAKNEIVGARDFWYGGIVSYFNSALNEIRIRICHEILGDGGITMEKQIVQWFLQQIRREPDISFFAPESFNFYDYLNEIVERIENIRSRIKEIEMTPLK